MIVEWIRKTCLAFPQATDSVQWGNNLVLKVAGKIFAIAALEPGDGCVSLKVPQERFAELVEREGIAPAPYLARAYWILVESEDAVPRDELKQMLRLSYDLVVAKLPRKTRAQILGDG